uniref:Uncharacterized protein n=1 Tax=viral metagenome TaxID=1070528 RepID=A0A6H1Z9I9_9ZZZZ
MPTVQQSTIPVPGQESSISTPRQVLRPRQPRKDKGGNHALSGKALARDNALTEEQWLKVYDAFQLSGVPSVLESETGIEARDVQHLLEIGVRRLGLPPIREHAIDLAEVNVRLMKRGMENGLPSSRDPNSAFTTDLPEVQDAVTERVAREAAAAQAVLVGSMHAATIFQKMLSCVFEYIQEPDKLAMPDKITMSYLKTLAEVGDKIASATDRAVRLNRLAAGEPESNVNVLVAHLVGSLPPDVLQRFGETGQIPPELRGRVQAQVPMIEAHAELVTEDDSDA